MFCITFVGWKEPVNSKNVINLFLDFFSIAEIPPSVWIAASDEDGKAVLGKRKIHRDRDYEYYELTLRHERKEVKGTWDVSCIFYDTNHPNEPTKGLSCLQISMSLSLIKDKYLMLLNFYDFIARFISFGYGYFFCSPYSINQEVYGPGLASSGVLCKKSEDPYLWSMKIMESISKKTRMPYEEGFLRFVYPGNFLNKTQLSARIEDESLESWIKSSLAHGSIKKISDEISLWSLTDEQLEFVRCFLGQNNLLISFKR